jgi:hypothetical protein
VRDYSASGIGFLLVDCYDGTVAAASTVSGSAVDSGADSAANIPVGGHARIVEMSCLRNGGDCCSQAGVHLSCASSFHLLMLPLSHCSPIDQMLEGREGVIHYLIMQGINQASQKSVLSLGISVDIFRCIARQLQESVSVLAD